MPSLVQIRLAPHQARGRGGKKEREENWRGGKKGGEEEQRERRGGGEEETGKGPTKQFVVKKKKN